jgi:orotate phosphoribosyltransferase
MKPNWIEIRKHAFDIIRDKSFHVGRITLSSGAQSDFYFDMKPTMLDPEGASLLAKLILHRLAGVKVDRIGVWLLARFRLLRQQSFRAIEADRYLVSS